MEQQQPEAAEAEFDDEWEEWDGISPFWVHCVAGSFAGVAEHVLVYPLDTVRTHIQVCAACHFNPATHNPSTQGVSHHAATAAASNAVRNSSSSNNKNIPGSILQKAAMSATNTTTITSTAANTIQKSTATAMHNPSMLQAIRQLISHPLALETAAATTTTTTTKRRGVGLSRMKNHLILKFQKKQLFVSFFVTDLESTRWSPCTCSDMAVFTTTAKICMTLRAM